VTATGQSNNGIAGHFIAESSMVQRQITRALLITGTVCLLLPAATAAAQHRRGGGGGGGGGDGDGRPSVRVDVEVGTDEWYRGTYRGTVPADERAPGCVGYVPEEPNFILSLNTERWVRISVEARDDGDPVLLIGSRSGPVCNNDATRTTRNPEIVTHLEAGVYRVFVGAMEEGAEGRFDIHIADLARTEMTEIRDNERVSLVGMSGGRFDASDLGPGCIGAISGSPNHTVLVPVSRGLAITATSSSDLTLVVIAQDGAHCNDDGYLTLDPELVEWFPEGPLYIYVGSHNPRVNAYYTLTVTPSEPVSAFSDRTRPAAGR